jgi:hypothetical protein
MCYWAYARFKCVQYPGIYLVGYKLVCLYYTMVSPCYHVVRDGDIKLKGAKSEIVILVTYL